MKPKLKKINFRAMSKKKKILLIVACIALIAIVAAIVHAHNGSTKDEVVTQETVSAEKMTIKNTVSSKGEIVGSLDEKITPHTSYKLEKIKVSEGEAVKGKAQRSFCILMAHL